MAFPLAAALVGGSIIGNIFGASKSASAANKAADLEYRATQEATAEQRRQFDKSMELYQPIYNDSRRASSMYLSALGIPGAAGSTPGGPGLTGNEDAAYDAYGAAYSDVGAEWNRLSGTGQFADDDDYYRWHWQNFGQKEGRTVPQNVLQEQNPQAAQPAMTQAGVYDMVRNQPGYQAQLQEGIGVLDRAAVGGRNLNSGRRMMALNDHGQKTFGGYYDKWLTRVGDVAGQGSATAGQMSAAGQNFANQSGQLLLNGAQAKGAGAINSANAWNNGLNNVMQVGAYMYGAGK